MDHSPWTRVPRREPIAPIRAREAGLVEMVFQVDSDAALRGVGRAHTDAEKVAHPADATNL